MLSIAKTFLFLLVSVVACLPVSAQSFQDAKFTKHYWVTPNNFHFTSKNSNYLVNGKNGIVTETKGRTKKKFNLPIPKKAEVQAVKYLRLRDDLLIVVERNFGPDGSDGLLIRIDTATNRIKWKARIPTFNLAASAQQKFAYVAGMGHLAKIDLTNGKVIWRRDDLYTEKLGMINAPAPPALKLRTVILSEDPRHASANRRTPRQLVFNKNSGAIMK